MNRKVKVLLSTFLGATMVGSLLSFGNYQKTEERNVAQNVVNEKKTIFKTYTVSESSLNKIVRIAKKDGSNAAEQVNKLTGNDFEAAVNEVLATYYESGRLEQLENFVTNVDNRADAIIEQYADAAKEREDEEELPYEANTAILTFGENISTEEIEAIIADQYGECDYIYECSDGTYMVKVNTIGMTSETAAEVFSEYSQAVSAEVNGKVEQCVEAWDMINDPYRYNEYYLQQLQIGDAWQYINGRSHSKIKVAVIDGSGIDINTNVDLTNVSNKSESICYNEDGSYYPMTQCTTSFSTSNMHMINCAGLVAAQSNNGAQVAGVASGTNNDIAEIVNVAIPLTVDKIAMGVDYAREKGCKVVNLSLFHEGSYDYEQAAINRFIAAGGTVVAGAGNNGADLNGYPSDYSNVISVIATNEDKTRRGTSNYGWECNVCAPGTNIAVCGPRDEVWITNGTSMASPIVAGVVAMMYSVNSGLNASTVMDVLQNTATDLGDAGRDYYYAYGLVNAYKAVTAVGGSESESTQSSGPLEVVGLVVESPSANTIDVVWGSNTEMESKGQKYNIYLDGNKVSSEVGCGKYRISSVSAGNHTVKVTSVYNGMESSGVSLSVSVAESQTTTTTAQSSDGYTTAGENWTELNYWSVYFASGWAGNPKGEYKDGGSYSNFAVKVNSASEGEWGIQLKTKELSAQANENYTCRIKINSNMAVGDVIVFKEDKSQTYKMIGLNQGDNEITLEFESIGTNQIVLGLGNLPAGVELKITSFSIEESSTSVETTTQPATTSNQQIVNGPQTPVGLVLTPNDEAQFFTVAFASVADATSYNVYVDGRLLKSIFNGQTIPYEEVGSGTHSIQVSALNDSGESGLSTVVEISIPEIATTATETTTQEEQTEPTTRTFNAYEKIEAEYFAKKEGGVIDNNSSVSNGQNIGGVVNGVTLQYDNIIFEEQAKGFSICYSSKSSDASGYVDVYIDSKDNRVAQITLPNTGSDWSGYTELNVELDSAIDTGEHTLIVIFNTTDSKTYVANIDYFKFIPASEYIKTIEGGIEINGSMINANIGGTRIIYSVDSEINGMEVVNSGLVYSLSDFMNGEDIFVGSSNKYVYSYESTKTKGKLPTVYSDSDIATSYAITMLLVNQATLEYTTTWKVKAYAKLSDGSYVYSMPYTYTIFDIADEAYRLGKMSNEASHKYLYDTILSKVDKNYSELPYVPSN